MNKLDDEIGIGVGEGSDLESNMSPTHMVRSNNTCSLKSSHVNNF